MLIDCLISRSQSAINHPELDLPVGMCGKPKIGSDVVLTTELSTKFDICSCGLPTETGCSPQFMLKLRKNSVTCIDCADKERFKTLPKQSLADFRMQLYYLLVVIVVSDSKAVIFVVNYLFSSYIAVNNYNIPTEPRFYNQTKRIPNRIQVFLQN